MPQFVAQVTVGRSNLINGVQEALHRMADHHFVGLEWYGMGGQGKSRLLAEAKNHCRGEGFGIHATIDFRDYDLHSSNPDLRPPYLRLIRKIYEQLHNTFPGMQKAIDELTALDREFAGVFSTERQPFEFDTLDYRQSLELREKLLPILARLSAEMGDTPLVLFLDSIERCPEKALEFLGRAFIAPLIENQYIRGIILFAGGRGSRLLDIAWPTHLKEHITSIQLSPLDFDASTEQINYFDPTGRFTYLAPEVFPLSAGHPLSNERLVEELSKLGTPVPTSNLKRHLLAKVLYDEVLKQKVLILDEQWVLEIVEIGAILRRFEAASVKRLLAVKNPNAQDLPIQWYISRIGNQLRYAPQYLVANVATESPLSGLDRTLRKLMHTALAVLYPEITIALHEEALKYWQESLNSGDTPNEAYILEILYHLSQLAMVSQQDIDLSVIQADLSVEVQSYFSHHLRNNYPRLFVQRNLQPLNNLKNLLEKDQDLRELLGNACITQIISLIEQHIQPAASEHPTFEPSYLYIRFSDPSSITVSWNRVSDVVLPEQTIESPARFGADQWLRDARRIGQAVYRSFLPAGTQDALKRWHNLSIQLNTDWVDIPWELMYDGNEFLCLSRPFGRKPRMVREAREHPLRAADAVRQALVVGNPTGDLPGAEKEAVAVADLLEQANIKVDRLIGPKDATTANFSLLLSNEPYDLVHFAGHGNFDHANPHLSGLRFADHSLRGENLERIPLSRAFYFISACEAGESSVEDNKLGFRGKFIEGLAISALLGGALGCLAPMWKIPDDEAVDFAMTFYEQVLIGQPIGEAVRQARLAVRETSFRMWASWLLYGDPLQKLPLGTLVS